MDLKGVVKNFGAGTWVRVSTVLFKLVQVPLLLAYLGPEDYGRWLILYSLPSWLSYASQGFGSVAANEMPISIAAGDLGAAKRVYSTSLVFMIFLAVAGFFISVAVAPILPLDELLEAAASRSDEITTAVVVLVLSMFLSFIGELYFGRFRAAQKAHVSIFITSLHSWIELAALFVCLQFTQRFDHIALTVLLSTVFYLSLYGWLSFRAFPELKFSWKYVDKAQFRSLFRLGVAFQAFPLGNALLFQGNLLAIQLILGPAAVALYGTARTMVRVVNQSLDLVSKSIWPELSYQFGRQDYHAARYLHRLGVGLCLLLAIGGVIALSFTGDILYRLWLGDEIHLPLHLLILFLIPIPFNALWLTSSTVLMASNKHGELSRRYVVATLLAAIGCALLTWWFGIEGAAVSTLIADLILIPHVLQQAMLLTRDNLSAFVPGTIKAVQLSGRRLIVKLKAL